MRDLSPSISFRVASEADQDFLLGVYSSTRTEELAPLPWSDAEKESFLRSQFGAQQAHYETHFGDGEHAVIVVDGNDAGRVWVWRVKEEIRVIDIAILPRFRGRGTGTAVLSAILDEGRATGRPVTIHVERYNASAQRLYERLGFRLAADEGVYLFLRKDPVS